MSEITKIILASGSAARQSMLRDVGLEFDIIPADIDEDALLQKGVAQQKSVPKITNLLAQQKALSISAQHKNALIIGSDQTLEFEGQILTKAANPKEAEAKLKKLRGKTHFLHSAVCVAHNNQVLFSCVECAELTMRNFDDDFLLNYMAQNADALTSCVGAYKIEGRGLWLFSSIQGNHHTIMGMPLLPLLCYLQDQHGVHS